MVREPHHDTSKNMFYYLLQLIHTTGYIQLKSISPTQTRFVT